MLTLSMTYKEMYDHLAADMQKVDLFIEKQRPKAIKTLKRERRFPNCLCYEYTAPNTRNSYIIYFYAEFRAHAESPTAGSFFYTYNNTKRYVVRWGAVAYRHTEDSEMIALRQLQVYTYHFFQRYKDRFLKKDNIPANELASVFLARNTIETPISVTDKVNFNAEKYGENCAAFKIQDGFCFARLKMESDSNAETGIPIAACSMHTTFLSSTELTNLQKAEIDRQNADIWGRLRDELSQGDITLTLNP